MSLIPGKIIEGKVVNITKFGAFIEVEDKVGLLHISEISKDYVKNVGDYLKENDTIRVKVISIDDDGKISLSIRALEPKKKSCAPEEVDWSKQKKVVPRKENFEDTLSKFLKESEDRFKDLKVQKNNARSGSRKN